MDNRCGRCAKCNRTKQIRRSRAAPSLLRSAKNRGSKLRRIADIERADSCGSAELVTAHRHQIASERVYIDTDSANRLRRIDMKNRTSLSTRGRQWREILNRPDLRIGQPQCDERGIAIRSDRFEHAFSIDASIGIGRNSHDLETAALELEERS